MLPFYISQMLGLQSKTHGYALVNQQGIRLVFREAADIERQPDEEAESLLIEWKDLVSMEAKRGLLSDSLALHTKQLAGRDPDGKDDQTVQLELERRHRDQLEEFERLVQEYQSGQRRDNVDEVLDDVRDLLDRM